MPNIINSINNSVDRKEARARFIMEQEKKAARRKPMKGKVKSGSLFAIRNKSVAIREGALRRVQIIIKFKKTTTGDVKKYIVAPYSKSYRRLKVGLRKSLWAYDMKEKRIKSFAVRNIKNVALTDRKYVPKWPVKFK